MSDLLKFSKLLRLTCLCGSIILCSFPKQILNQFWCNTTQNPPVQEWEIILLLKANKYLKNKMCPQIADVGRFLQFLIVL